MIEKKANTLKVCFMIHEAYISPPPQQTLECKLFYSWLIQEMLVTQGTFLFSLAGNLIAIQLENANEVIHFPQEC